MHKTKPYSKVEANQHILREYVADTGAEILDMRKVAEWAIERGLWTASEYDPFKVCARELSSAARAEYLTDPQGREVRKRHCYTIVDEKGQHRWLWIDIRTAKPKQMHVSLAARRRSALGDVFQLATDLASYNDNNMFGAQLEMSFNFDEDLSEMEHPEHYPEDSSDE